jgi:hypothetical protein
LRPSILELTAPAAAAGAPLTETLDLTDRLVVADSRARDHLRQEQRLLAGEIIFTEARDLLDAMHAQVVAARTAAVATASREHDRIRREQASLALAAGGILAFATILLVIPGAAASGGPEPMASSRPAQAPPDEFESSARVISRVPITSSTPAPAPPVPPHAVGDSAAVHARPASGTRRAVGASASAPQNTGEPRRDLAEAASSRGGAPGVNLRDAAAVCTELGRASQSVEISTLLDRAAKVLSASGAIVWLASPDRSEMFPAVAAGYDERLLARIGSIPRDASNVTAAAFRDTSPRTSGRSGSAAAALAVPLLTPLGPVGVFTAEIQEIASVDETRLAVATIFAAQLATLLGSMDAPAASTPAATGTDAAAASL